MATKKKRPRAEEGRGTEEGSSAQGCARSGGR